ncbi:class I SAM-dependent methyltransferase [Geodermatophilus aquaeductus]|uniref:Methyltransferase domain-containing protein n=1 Tax=Geodermatophilus aquaeductus TaxID=1564161 RepID=A0A521EI91_9ACTN|nr:class I SAM-dependent methyltransferase [Geodermatophilus aquaeductus]SMO83625.1 Methyltransferase domain-containing protein [Geodermatophilus aquaeductus]
MTADHFAGRVAEHYDESSAEMFDPAVVGPAVDLLAELADGGAALELGIGTGRLALPLSERGVPVHGIDLSPDMVARLRAKPGGARIPVRIGDFARTRVEGTFAVVYLVFNTVMNLTSQEDQVACFANAAGHLRPGGRFVVEVGVPDLQRLPPGERARPFALSPTRLGFDEYDVARQGLVSHHYTVTDGRLEVVSVPFRYVWPAELDLMARLAGLVSEDRWEDWRRRPFAGDSRAHVSVWRGPA